MSMIKTKKQQGRDAQDLMGAFFRCLAPCLPDMVKTATEGQPLTAEQTDMITLRLFADFYGRTLTLLEITKMNEQAGRTTEAWPIPKVIQEIADRRGVQLTP